jgi:hypothetical protein
MRVPQLNDGNMKKRLLLILMPIIASMSLIASCLYAAPSTPEESAATVPEPLVEMPPAELGTPNWVYAIIGIGAAVAVVIIVYIIRSRKSRF